MIGRFLQWVWGGIVDETLSVLVAVMVVPATLLVNRARMLTRSRRLWHRRADATVKVVLSKAAMKVEEYDRPVTGLGQLFALAWLFESLQRAYGIKPEEAIRFPDDVLGDAALGCDLVLLGGPKTNEVTARVFAARPASPLRMVVTGTEDQRRTTIEWCDGEGEGGIEVFPKPEEPAPRPADGTFGVDYAVVMRCGNPFKDGATATVLAGLHTYGTDQAARFLIENASSFRRRHLRRRQFVRLVRFETNGRDVRNRTVVRSLEWGEV